MIEPSESFIQGKCAQYLDKQLRGESDWMFMKNGMKEAVLEYAKLMGITGYKAMTTWHTINWEKMFGKEENVKPRNSKET